LFGTLRQIVIRVEGVVSSTRAVKFMEHSRQALRAKDTVWLTFECRTCAATVPVRPGEAPRKATADWTLRCPSCNAVQKYPRGTLMRPSAR